MTVSRRTFIKGLAASGAAMSVSSPILANDGNLQILSLTDPITPLTY